jgi:membrane fusion protein (multidrug efflux system)
MAAGADDGIRPDRPPPANADPARSGPAPQGGGPKPGEGAGADDKAPEGKDGGDKKSVFKNPLVIAGIIAVVGLALIGGLLFWLSARNFESTDDAFIDVQIVRIAPQIAGQVTQVRVNDNQRVIAGQPLAEIDSADAQTRVAESQAHIAQAQAQVDNAREQIAVAGSALLQAQSDAEAARAQAENAALDLARYRSLQATNPAAVAQQQLDQAQAQARTTAAQFASALRAVKGRADQVQAARTQVSSGEQQVKADQAELKAARINYGYTALSAPVAGTIAQKTVQVGDYVQPGTQLMAVVPLNVWVTANFKETQLDNMRPGQPVTVHVDACPSAKVQGHVDSIQRGAGQAFAILPAQNATGNFVKVVQRVPVKILIDDVPRSCPLGPGMSVEPNVRVR